MHATEIKIMSARYEGNNGIIEQDQSRSRAGAGQEQELSVPFAPLWLSQAAYRKQQQQDQKQKEQQQWQELTRMLGIINITLQPAFPLFSHCACVCVCSYRFFVCFLAAPLPGFMHPAVPFNWQLTCSQAWAVALGRNTCKKMAKTCSRLFGASRCN